MALATKVLALAAPDLTPPSSVRQEGEEPRFVEAGPDGVAVAAVEQALIERSAVDPGSVAIIVPDSLVGPVGAALDAAGVEFGRAARNGFNSQITLVPVSLVKGLELDALGGGRARRDHGGGGAGRPLALRRPHPRDEAPGDRPRAPAPRGPAVAPPGLRAAATANWAICSAQSARDRPRTSRDDRDISPLLIRAGGAPDLPALRDVYRRASLSNDDDRALLLRAT